MDTETLAPDDWYNPAITTVEYALDPFDLALSRSLHRAFHGNPPSVALPLRTFSEGLADSPWLVAVSGCWMFNPAAREVIDEVAWPGDVRWLPLVVETASGVVDAYQVLAPPLVGGDLLSDTHTTRGPSGAPIRWVLDRDKLGDRQLAIVHELTGNGLVMRGRVLQRLLDLGAKGIVIRHARIAD